MSSNSCEFVEIHQCYLDEFTRVRFVEGKYELTIKSKCDTIRDEFTYPLSLTTDQFNSLKQFLPHISKKRYKICCDREGIVEVVIDVYDDMSVMEVEYDSIKSLNIPLEEIVSHDIIKCIEEEVTGDESYSNYCLAKRGVK